MPRPVTVTLQVSASAEAVAQGAAQLFADSIAQAVKVRGVARVAISGGSTPRDMFEMLADPSHPFLHGIPWERLQLFWVDERSVPPTDHDSNYRMTREAMLDTVPLPASNIHRIEAELAPEEAAARYEAEIRNAFKLEGAQTPTFDLVLLGIGPDGHTASLFPHTEGLNEMARIAIANHVPQLNTWRITLTWPVITAAREVAFLMEGAGKAEKVREVFAGEYKPEDLPSQLIRPANGKLTLVVDTAAVAELPGPPQVGTSTFELK